MKWYNVGKETDDRTEVLDPEGKSPEAGDWTAFQNKYVYPKLIESIEEYLPFK